MQQHAKFITFIGALTTFAFWSITASFAGELSLLPDNGLSTGEWALGMAFLYSGPILMLVGAWFWVQSVFKGTMDD